MARALKSKSKIEDLESHNKIQNEKGSKTMSYNKTQDKYLLRTAAKNAFIDPNKPIKD